MPLYVVGFLMLLGLLTSSCADVEEQRGSVEIEGVGFLNPLKPTLYTVRVKRSWVGNCSRTPYGTCSSFIVPWQVNLIEFNWSTGNENTLLLRRVATKDFPSFQDPQSRFAFDEDQSVTGTFTVSFPSPSASLRVKLTSVTQSVDGDTTFYAWSNSLSKPPPSAAPSQVPVAPTVRVFAHASPAGDGGTLLDARLSTGVGTLTYAWSEHCAGTTYHGASVPAGTAVVDNGYTGQCAVTVQAAATASQSIAVTSELGLENGAFAFDGSKTVTINGAHPTSGWAGLACVDVGGTGVYATPVPLVGTNPSTATFSLSDAQVSAGLHQIGATLWAAGANAGCAVTTTDGALQTIMDLYEGSGTGAAPRRLARPSAFVAASALRLVPSKTVSAGSIDAKSGLLRRATLSGTFTWSTPKLANGVRRPAGVANLAKGTYVMRSIGMQYGPRAGTATTLLGTGTLLLRGADGTLACGALTGGFNSSTLRLQSGTLSARRLVGTVEGAPVTYVFPPVPGLGAKRSDGVMGLVESVLGLLPGDQPADRAATKPTKPKPVKAAGTATLRTAAKATALTAACKALVRYLP